MRKRSLRRRIGMNKVVERPTSCTCASDSLLTRISTEEDGQNKTRLLGKRVKCFSYRILPSSYRSKVLRVMTDLCLKQELDSNRLHHFQEYSRLTLEDVQNLINFVGERIPPLNSLIWHWSRSILYWFKISSGFTYEDGVFRMNPPETELTMRTCRIIIWNGWEYIIPMVI